MSSRYWLATSPLLGAVVWLIFTVSPSRDLVLGNLLAPLLAWASFAWVLSRKRTDTRWWLGLAGFTLAAVGLKVYLHLAFLLDWKDLASKAVTPSLMFAYLPYYALVAGLIGFWIGWIVGSGILNSRKSAR